MLPFLRQGDKLVIKKAPADDLRVGDIILYRASNQLVCHRLVKKAKVKGGYVLYARGDNSDSAPEPVTESMCSGKVIGIIKRGKMISVTHCLPRLAGRLIVATAPWITAAAKTKRALRL